MTELRCVCEAWRWDKRAQVKALSMTRSRAGPNPRKFFVSRLGREKNYCVIFVSKFSCFVVPLAKVVPDGCWVARAGVLAVIEFQSGGSTPRQTAQGLVRGQLQIRYEAILTSGFRIPRLTGG